ncbi:MAG: methyltransferase domain-containing protein [Hyphomicrobiales bacterium]|nr:methyltransferase domain-containing protein [Hyphomicrobiales bacterium]
MSDSREIDIFFEIHCGLPQEGPGSFDSTKRALELAGSFPERAELLDVGCGPGRQTMDLARLLPSAIIDALDNHAPFLRAVQRKTTDAGVFNRVTAVEGDMAHLPTGPGSLDLIWCEGAAYIMGLRNALESWKPHLKTGGRIALTEPVWLRPEPPAETVEAFSEYPTMRDPQGCREIVETCGYKLLGDFTLPEQDWLNYYEPLEARIKVLRDKYSDDATALMVLDKEQAEIDDYRRNSSYYGYLFLIMSA